MKSGVRVAGAIAVGYLLGRNRRLALATMLGVAAATGQLSRARGDLTQRAAGALKDAGMDKLAKPGQQLVDAGKEAVFAALTSRVDTLRGRIDERADALRTPLDVGQKQKGGEPEEPRKHKPPEGRKRGDERAEAEEPAEAEEAEGAEEPEEPEEAEGAEEAEEPEEPEEAEGAEGAEEPEEAEGAEEAEEAEEEESGEDEEARGEPRARKRSDEGEPRRTRSAEREDRSPRGRAGQKTGNRDGATVGAPVRRSGR